MKIKYILIFSFALVLLLSGAIHGEEVPAKDKEERESLYTTSDELKSKYQTVNASIFSVLIDPYYYTGPHAGPGFITGYNGPYFIINWLNKKDKNENNSRYIGFKSIINIDKPIVRKEKLDYYIVYYKGPCGNTEFALLMDKGDSKITKDFIERWRSYLLSQEPVN